MDITSLENEISKKRKYLNFISILYKQILNTSKAEKNVSKLLKREQNNFEQNFQKGNKKKFYAKRSRIFSKLTKQRTFEISEHDVNDMVTNIKQKYQFDQEQFDKIHSFIINKVFVSYNLNIKVVLDDLLREYNSTLQQIENLENQIENLKKPQKEEEKTNSNLNIQTQAKDISELENIDSPSIKTQSISKTQIVQSKLENDFAITQYDNIIKGPRKKTIGNLISGYDPFFDDVETLYSLATQIVILICSEQDANTFINENPEHPIYHSKTCYISDEEKQVIYKKFGVTSIDGLLQRYDSMQQKLHDKFKKLSPEEKEKCKFPYSVQTLPKTIVNNYDTAMEKENFDFPPSKNEIIRIINKRVLNINSFGPIAPAKYPDGKVTIIPKDINEYKDQRNVFEKLIKYMSTEQVSLLYNNVKRSYSLGMNSAYPAIRTENEVECESYYAILQNLFCDLVIEKENKEFKNDEELEIEKVKIIETMFKEKIKFPLKYVKMSSKTSPIDEEAARRIALSNQDEGINDVALELNNSNGMKL